MRFVLDLARLRARSLPYLLHGRMLRAPDIESPYAEIPMSRLSIYAGQQGALREFEGAYPVLFHAAWRAPDGGIAVAAANTGDDSLPIAFKLQAPDWPLPESGGVWRDDAEGSTLLHEFAVGSVMIEDEIPAATVRLYRVVAAD